MRTRQVAYGLLRLGEPPHLMSVRSHAELCFDGSPSDRFIDQPVSLCSLVQVERCGLRAPFDHGANSFAGPSTGSAAMVERYCSGVRCGQVVGPIRSTVPGDLLHPSGTVVL